MKELPYFKFYPNQWITGSISFMDLDVQGAFMKVCCYYWSKECNVTRKQIKTLIPKQWSTLLDAELFKIEEEAISIKWLDEQYQQRLVEHKRNVSNGKKGGLSRAQALRKEKKRKDKYADDNLLKVNDDINTYKRFAHLSMSLDEFKKLEENYTKEQIDSVCDAIQNFKKNTNYKSLYLTAKNWLKKEQTKQELETIKGFKAPWD